MKTVAHAFMLWYVSHASVSSAYCIAYSGACKRYHNITVYTTVFLKMNPRVRNVKTTSKLKIKILI